MFESLPTDARAVLDWQWAQFAPYFASLEDREIIVGSISEWLSDWSHLHNLTSEAFTRLRLAHDQDTTNADAEKRYFEFLENILPSVERSEKALKDRLLQSDMAHEQLGEQDMRLPLRKLRAESELFREANIPLQVALSKLGSRYQKIVGNQTAVWDGEERPLPQLKPYLNDPDRAVREKVWQVSQERRLEDRQALNELWQEMLPLRRRVASNAECADFREYQWKAYKRFDYTPDNAQQFHGAIAEICVPAATRIYERHRRRLGVEQLRPWDLSDGEYSRPVDGDDRQPLRPYADSSDFLRKSTTLFQRVDSRLAENFVTMVNENLLDVENRAGKAPGGYCTYFATEKRPFIFMNAVGLHDDLQTMMHEAGHAFHAFASSNLPYHPQRRAPMEFNEVASMAMELLAASHLAGAGNGDGFYTQEEAARARIEHLENMILFWPYMVVVDAFQHWAYTRPDEAMDPYACDARWSSLWARYLPGVDWRGLEDVVCTGWHRKVHIFEVPFYYIEYGIAALGAAQVWMQAQQDQAAAIARYRSALALGGTASLPDLFAAAGARFAFDAATLRDVIAFLESQIDRLRAAS